MSGINGKGSLLVKPDGMSSDAEVLTVQLHDIAIPLPSHKSEDLAKLCMQKVVQRHPLSGVDITSLQFGMSPYAALVLLETHYALKKRDETIAALDERVNDLEVRLTDLEARHE